MIRIAGDDKPKEVVYADALDAVLKDYTAYTLNQKGRKSILLKLEQFKEMVAKIPKKVRNRKREIIR